MPNDFLEKTLEDIVFENRSTIHTRGLSRFKKTAFRQVILPSGKKIDILGFEINNGHFSYDLYELKRDVINIDAICQAYNYVEEINDLIRGSFKSCHPSITMVGKKYECISILNAVKIPVNVYTYEYKMDGIWFEKRQHSVGYYRPHEHFSLGLLAFGCDMLEFSQGSPSSISFHSTIQRHLLNNIGFEQILKQKKFDYLNEIQDGAVEFVSISHKIEVKTEVFPSQPAWSIEFANGIPYEDIFDEFEFEVDDCDEEYTYEDFEQDVDDEPNGDDEREYYLERDFYVLFEPIHFEGWTLSELILPKLYFVSKPYIRGSIED